MSMGFSEEQKKQFVKRNQRIEGIIFALEQQLREAKDVQLHSLVDDIRKTLTRVRHTYAQMVEAQKNQGIIQ